MHMNEMAGTARLVQRIDILRDGEQLEPRQRAMRLIRRGLRMPCPAQILEGMDRRGIANKALRRRHLFEVELRPQPALVAERGEPTLRRKPAPVRTTIFSNRIVPAGLKPTLILSKRSAPRKFNPDHESVKRPFGAFANFELRPEQARQGHPENTQGYEHLGAGLSVGHLARSPALGAVAQIVVGEHDGDHGLADRHGTDADTRIVAALGRNLGVITGGVHRAARRQDR